MPNQLTVLQFGTGSFYPGVKRPGRCIEQTSPSWVQIKERVVLYLHSFSVSYGMLQMVL